MDKDIQQLQQRQGMIADGFSSEEQIYMKKNVSQEQKKNQGNKDQKQQVKFVLPPPQQIKSKPYSLLPDKLTGWGIKANQPNPIPITFGNRSLDNLIIKMLQNPHKNYQVVYLGPRYQNTFHAWRDKPFKFPYSHINMPKNIKYKKRPFLGPNSQIEDCILFDSIFQSGNLDVAVKVNSHQYDLFVRVDSNTRGHFNWFNFVVSGMKVKEKYKLNICNLQRGFCLYTRGMKPYMKSLRIKNDKWKQSGLNVTYSKKQIRFAKYYGFEQFSLYLRPPKQWNLSFEIEGETQNDEIKISYCVPYTYSNMLKTIEELCENYQSKSSIKTGKSTIKQQVLCKSLGGLPIPMITITQPQKQEQKENKKKCVIICGRVHPGESNSSFMMEGFLKFICGQSHQAKSLRREVVFKIVPMLNPDGVVLGNYRTGLSGKDFNRQYRNPDKQIFPQVYFFKKLVTETKLSFKNNLFMFLDFHGHSTKKNVFAYGPQFSMVDKYYYQARVFVKMLEKQNKMFRYHSCIFKVSQTKQTTARAILMKKINIPFTYTIEASNGFYHDKDLLLSVPFQVDEWIEMGVSIGKTINQYLQCMLASEKTKKDRQKAKIQSNKIKKQGLVTKLANNSLKKKQTNPSLLMAQQDAKIQKIYDQILKQQNEGPEQQNSDDNISEGSSDKEDDKDDLSRKQLETLFNSIKNNNKLGKNKNKLGRIKRIDLTFGQVIGDKNQSDEDQPVVQEYKPMFRIKKSIQIQRNSQPIQQVFIAHKVSFFSTQQKKMSNPQQYLSKKKEKIPYKFGDTLKSTKIINYNFEQEKKNKLMETISVFPSFSFKSKNTIVISSHNDSGDSLQKSTREFVISNLGASPRQIKLHKNAHFDKTIDSLEGGMGRQLQKKLEFIGVDKFKNSYSRFTRRGFHQSKGKKGSFSKPQQNHFHRFL